MRQYHNIEKSGVIRSYKYVLSAFFFKLCLRIYKYLLKLDLNVSVQILC